MFFSVRIAQPSAVVTVDGNETKSPKYPFLQLLFHPLPSSHVASATGIVRP